MLKHENRDPDDHHLYKRKDGKWSVQIRIREPKTGSTIRIRTSLHTYDRKIARIRRDQILGEQPLRLTADSLLERATRLIGSNDSGNNQGISEHITLRSRPQFNEILEKFLRSRKEISKTSEKSIHGYRLRANALHDFLGYDPLLMTKSDASDFVLALTQAGKRDWMLSGKLRAALNIPGKKTLAGKSVNNIVADLITFFHWCISKEYVKKNPFADVDLPSKRPVKYRPKITPDIADRLCTIPPPENETFDQLEWEVALRMARHLGCRLGELLSLDKAAFDFSSNIPTVRFITGKQQRSSHDNVSRTVPIPSKIIDMSRRLYMRCSSGPIFMSLTTKSERSNYDNGREGLGKWFSRYWCARAKLILPGVYFHRWRGYAISQLLNAHVPLEWVQRIVGHTVRGMERNSMTERYYDTDFSAMLKYVDLIA